MTPSSRTWVLATLLLLSANCQSVDSNEPSLRSAFGGVPLAAIRDSVPIGPSQSLILTRPHFSAVEIATIARAMATVVGEEDLPPVDAIPPEQFASFEEAAKAVEGRVWLTMEAGEQKLGFELYPQKPAIRVGVMDRSKPNFTAAGTYPGVGRDMALLSARRCADVLAELDVIAASSYLPEPVLERAQGSSFPAVDDPEAKVEVTDHYHFVFGQAPNGILLGNSELTIDVDAHSGECFRIEVDFIEQQQGRAVDLIVSADAAKAAVEADIPSTGGKKVVDEGRVVYWLEPELASSEIEPRFVSSYTVVSEEGIAASPVPFAVLLSQEPPVIDEF